MKLILTLLALISATALSAAENKDGAKYKKALIEAIQSADQITITEHSHSDDFRQANTKAPKTDNIYKKATLTPRIAPNRMTPKSSQEKG